MPRKVPQSWSWWKVSSPRISEPYIVAAATKRQAATIIGKMFGVFIDPESNQNTIEFIRRVDEINYKPIKPIAAKLWYIENS